MQYLTETEINLIVNVLYSSAQIKEKAIEEMKDKTYSGLLKLRADQFRGIADRLARAAITGDKRIEIRR